jgi:two-component system sensor histidine kinase KdpD
LSAKEQSVAQWSYDLKQMAGLGTQTLPFSEALYVPLIGTQMIVGVLHIKPKEVKQFLLPENMHALEACVRQIAFALEVDLLK